jgi:ankyrin repeat protein
MNWESVHVNAFDFFLLLFSGATPLDWSSLNGHIEFCRLLLEKGADIHAQDNK